MAEEVRKLALESKLTVASIKEMTENVQQAIALLIKDTNDILGFISKEVNGDYKRFIEIALQYKQDASIFSGLTLDASERGESVSTIVSEVTNAINEIAIIINQSAQGVGEIAEATDDSTQALVSVHGSAKSLESMNIKLARLARQFKV